MNNDLNFDSAAVQLPGGGYNLITAAEFMALPLAERLQLLTTGKVQFMLNGVLVSPKDAMKKRAG